MTAPTAPLDIVVLVSGRGSNLKAVAAQADAGALPVRIVAVVSDKADAGALEWARERGIATIALSPGEFTDRDSYCTALGDIVAGLRPGLVVLAGFMRILSDEFVHRFIGRMLNIHPRCCRSIPGCTRTGARSPQAIPSTAPAFISSRPNSTAARWSYKPGFRCCRATMKTRSPPAYCARNT